MNHHVQIDDHLDLSHVDMMATTPETSIDTTHITLTSTESSSSFEIGVSFSDDVQISTLTTNSSKTNMVIEDGNIISDVDTLTRADNLEYSLYFIQDRTSDKLDYRKFFETNTHY